MRSSAAGGDSSGAGGDSSGAASASAPPAADAAAEGWELVRQHGDPEACWIVVAGRVLDATSYLGHHPGGAAVIERLAGRDATAAYAAARHSRAADMKLHDYDVGALTDVRRLRRAAREAAEHRERLRAIAHYLE